MPIAQHDIGYLLDTARELAARVAANADRIDCERQIPPELAGEIADKGFFRLLVPRSLGGAELGHLDFLRILQVFAEVDGSTAWCINQNNVFATASVIMPEQTAREIWADARAVVANGPPITSVKAIPVDGGYRLSGRWNFSTGSAHATNFLDTARKLAARVAANADRIDCERQIPPELAGEIADKGFFRYGIS